MRYMGKITDPKDLTTKEYVDAALPVYEGNKGEVLGFVENNTVGAMDLELDKKADIVDEATAGHFAGLDVNGNLTDSGSKAADFATAAQGAKADTALQTHQTVTLEGGTNSGTLKLTTNAGTVDNIAVTGLGSAAYTETSAYATAAQGIKADTALQAHQSVTLESGTNNGTLKLTTNAGTVDNIPVKGLGSAAYTESNAYATSAQGTKADTAYQKPSDGIPSTDMTEAVQTSLGKADSAIQSHQTVTLASGTDNGTLKITTNAGTVDNIAVTGLGSAAFTNSNAYATAAQGTKADNAEPATTAVRHTASTAVGANNQPVYVDANGNAVAINYEINKTVPSDAVFTDTHYTNSLKIQGNGTDAIEFTQDANKILNIKGSGDTTVAKTADGEITISSTNPTVNDATLTLKIAGTQKTTFSANQATDAEFNVTASDLGLSQALVFKGITTTDLKDGDTTSPIAMDDETSLTPDIGNVVITKSTVTTNPNTEFVWANAKWNKLGDAKSYALSSITVNGTGALSGGGDLTSNREISHVAGNAASQESGLYKFSTDAYSHINSVTAVVKSDITALGIPEADTHYTDALTIKGDGTTAVTFEQNAAKSLDIKAGNNVTVSATDGEITIASSYVDTNQTVKGNGTTFNADAAVDIVAGDNVTVTADSTNNTITIAAEDGLPSQESHSGQFLTTDGSNASWATVDALPAQSGHSGEYLTTDGSSASWSAIDLSSKADIAAPQLTTKVESETTYYPRAVTVGGSSTPNLSDSSENIATTKWVQNLINKLVGYDVDESSNTLSASPLDNIADNQLTLVSTAATISQISGDEYSFDIVV